jgi:glycosyltransferase involved in cell wall biosynthesis
MVAMKLKLTKWFLLPLGANIPMGMQVQAPEVRGENPIFVYAGTLDGRDLSVLLHAFKLASASVVSRLRIIGDGECRLELEAIASKLGITNEVDFVGHIPHGSKFSELLSTSTLGIVHVPPTPYYAGQPSTKLYEYWAHGLPVLCSNYPSGAGELEIGTGLVYEFNSRDLAECMVRSVRNIEDFNLPKIKELALEHTWEKIVKNYLEPVIGLDNF